MQFPASQSPLNIKLWNRNKLALFLLRVGSDMHVCFFGMPVLAVAVFLALAEQDLVQNLVDAASFYVKYRLRLLVYLLDAGEVDGDECSSRDARKQEEEQITTTTERGSPW